MSLVTFLIFLAGQPRPVMQKQMQVAGVESCRFPPLRGKVLLDGKWQAVKIRATCAPKQ